MKRVTAEPPPFQVLPALSVFRPEFARFGPDRDAWIQTNALPFLLTN